MLESSGFLLSCCDVLELASESAQDYVYFRHFVPAGKRACVPCDIVVDKLYVNVCANAIG